MSDEPTLTEAYQQGRDDERAAIFSLPGKPLWVPPDTTATFISAERAVLLDLIAELRAQHYADQCECGCEQWYECEPCSHISLCPTQEAAVRAEARLREVQGE